MKKQLFLVVCIKIFKKFLTFSVELNGLTKTLFIAGSNQAGNNLTLKGWPLTVSSISTMFIPSSSIVIFFLAALLCTYYTLSEFRYTMFLIGNGLHFFPALNDLFKRNCM